eukprot:s3662_g1.t1
MSIEDVNETHLLMQNAEENGLAWMTRIGSAGAYAPWEVTEDVRRDPELLVGGTQCVFDWELLEQEAAERLLQKAVLIDFKKAVDLLASLQAALALVRRLAPQPDMSMKDLCLRWLDASQLHGLMQRQDAWPECSGLKVGHLVHLFEMVELQAARDILQADVISPIYCQALTTSNLGCVQTWRGSTALRAQEGRWLSHGQHKPTDLVSIYAEKALRQVPRDVDQNEKALEELFGGLILANIRNALEVDERPPWSAHVIGQKLEHSGQCFILHEVFGAGPTGERTESNAPRQSLADHELEGNTDCVICLSEPRDTAVLPCRHMCFCSYCAGIVRHRQSVALHFDDFPWKVGRSSSVIAVQCVGKKYRVCCSSNARNFSQFNRKLPSQRLPSARTNEPHAPKIAGSAHGRDGRQTWLQWFVSKTLVVGASYKRHYLFLLEPQEGTAFICLSPERLCKVRGRDVWTEAVAGTWPITEFQKIGEAALLASSAKHSSEHQMVVDYICKLLDDIASHVKVCDTHILKLKHLVHIKQSYHALAKQGPSGDPFNLATFFCERMSPTPAVCGLPAADARDFINQAEPWDRGFYAAPCGVLSSQSCELIVALRGKRLVGAG